MGTSLPTNVDASYADDPNDPSRVTHQKHHDAIHDFTNTHDGKLGAAAHAGLAIVSATAPASPVDNQLWYDTAAELMKRWDAAANAGAGAWKTEGNAAYHPLMTLGVVNATKPATQALSAATFTKVTYGTEVTDDLAEYDPATSRLTSGSGGTYVVAPSISAGASAGGVRFILLIYKNGVVYQRVADSTYQTNNTETRSGTAILKLAASDYVEVYAYCSAAITLNANGDSDAWLNIAKVA